MLLHGRAEGRAVEFDGAGVDRRPGERRGRGGGVAGGLFPAKGRRADGNVGRGVPAEGEGEGPGEGRPAAEDGEGDFLDFVLGARRVEPHRLDLADGSMFGGAAAHGAGCHELGADGQGAPEAAVERGRVEEAGAPDGDLGAAQNGAGGGGYRVDGALGLVLEGEAGASEVVAVGRDVDDDEAALAPLPRDVAQLVAETAPEAGRDALDGAAVDEHRGDVEHRGGDTAALLLGGRHDLSKAAPQRRVREGVAEVGLRDAAPAPALHDGAASRGHGGEVEPGDDDDRAARHGARLGRKAVHLGLVGECEEPGATRQARGSVQESELLDGDAHAPDGPRRGRAAHLGGRHEGGRNVKSAVGPRGGHGRRRGRVGLRPKAADQVGALGEAAAGHNDGGPPAGGARVRGDADDGRGGVEAEEDGRGSFGGRAVVLAVAGDADGAAALDDLVDVEGDVRAAEALGVGAEERDVADVGGDAEGGEGDEPRVVHVPAAPGLRAAPHHPDIPDARGGHEGVCQLLRRRVERDRPGEAPRAAGGLGRTAGVGIRAGGQLEAEGARDALEPADNLGHHDAGGGAQEARRVGTDEADVPHRSTRREVHGPHVPTADCRAGARDGDAVEERRKAHELVPHKARRGVVGEGRRAAPGKAEAK